MYCWHLVFMQSVAGLLYASTAWDGDILTLVFASPFSCVPSRRKMGWPRTKVTPLALRQFRFDRYGVGILNRSLEQGLLVTVPVQRVSVHFLKSGADHPFQIRSSLENVCVWVDVVVIVSVPVYRPEPCIVARSVVSYGRICTEGSLHSSHVGHHIVSFLSSGMVALKIMAVLMKTCS